VLGTIADYQELTKPSGTNLRPALMRAVLVNRLTVQGVIVYDHESLRDAFEREMIPWVVSEAVRYEHEIYDGLASAPGAFTRLLRGEHYAKVVVRL
jgi:NADPH-dependent curcumin reductase CurA